MQSRLVTSIVLFLAALTGCGGERTDQQNDRSGGNGSGESSDLTFDGPGGSFALTLPELPKDVAPLVSNVQLALLDQAGNGVQKQSGIYKPGITFSFEKLKPAAYVVKVMLLDEKQNPVMKGGSDVKIAANQTARTEIRLRPIKDGTGSLNVVIDPITKPEPQPEPKPEPKPEPTPDPAPRKCGVNSFSVAGACKAPNDKLFDGATFECYDGATFKVALGANQCMSSDEILKTWSAKCENHCSK